MAQYWWSPNPSDEGGDPLELYPWGYHSTSGENVEYEVKYDADLDRYYLEVDPQGGTGFVITPRDNSGEPFGIATGAWDAPANIELFCEWLYDHTETGTDAAGRPLVVRYTGREDGFSDSQETYRYGPDMAPEETRLSWGTTTLASGKEMDRDQYVNKLIGIRLQAIDDQLKGRVWVIGDLEPEDWDVEVSDTSAMPGEEDRYKVGFGSGNGRGTYRIYGFGIGTDDDPAPLGPPGFDIPTNLKTKQITETTARLEWDAPE